MGQRGRGLGQRAIRRPGPAGRLLAVVPAAVAVVGGAVGLAAAGPALARRAAAPTFAPHLGATAPRPAAGPACAHPAYAGGELTESLDGRISACWLVTPQRPGVDEVGLQSFVSSGTTGAPLGQAVSLHLTPASGLPGQHVVVSGRLARAIPASAAESQADVCFDTCAGLTENALVSWSRTPGSSVVQDFTTNATLPAAPWFLGRSPHGLVSGIYPIGVACAGVLVGGCAAAGAQGSAPFRLEVAHPVHCSPARPCASLRLSPPDAPPGTAVAVTGTAPLSSLVGAPFGPTLVVSAPSGALGPANPDDVLDAHTRFGALAGTSWASLASTQPLATAAAGPSPGPFSLDGASPGTIAHCVPGAVDLVSAATGAVTGRVPTGAVAKVRLGGLFLAPHPTRSTPPTCVAVLADPERAGTYYATFQVVNRDGAPPVYQAGLSTTDGGASWHLVPAPPGAAKDSLSGFELAAGGSIEAVFSPAGSTGAAPRLVVEASPAGAARFAPARPACPSVGPCLLLGPYVWGNCAMNGTSQQLLVRSPHGFAPAGGGGSWPGPLDACTPAELAATGPAGALVVDSGSVFPLERTTDGGHSFEAIALPPLTLPGGGGTLDRGTPYPPGSGGLLLLPDGALLATTFDEPATAAPPAPGSTTTSGAPLAAAGGAPPRRAWHLLEPRATGWCAVAPFELSVPRLASNATVGPVEALAGDLWWQVSTTEGPVGTPVAVSLEHVPLTAIACA